MIGAYLQGKVIADFLLNSNYTHFKVKKVNINKRKL